MCGWELLEGLGYKICVFLIVVNCGKIYMIGGMVLFGILWKVFVYDLVVNFWSDGFEIFGDSLMVGFVILLFGIGG